MALEIGMDVHRTDVSVVLEFCEAANGAVVLIDESRSIGLPFTPLFFVGGRACPRINVSRRIIPTIDFLNCLVIKGCIANASFGVARRIISVAAGRPNEN